ncbi:MAG: hypothetical protein Q7S09_01770 [bacterium]|nr:hypothetical protein [bacterium]
MPKNIVLFGGSLHPPGKHHVEIVRTLIPYFDEVIIFPCGSARRDKPSLDEVSNEDRAVMVRLAFEELPVRIDLSDLERHIFTPTWDLDERFHREGAVWHVAGTDLICGGRHGESVIQREWVNGKALWEVCNFAIIVRQNYPFDSDDLPPRHRIFEPEHSGSSSQIRQRIAFGKPFEELVAPGVAAYIKRHGLYGWKERL